MKLAVPASSDGERLDKFLSGVIKDISRTALGDLLRKAGMKPSSKISAGEIIEIPDFKPACSAASQPEDIDVEILFEDDDVIVINKPAGLVVHPGAGRRGGTLVNALLSKSKLSSIGSVLGREGIVHRLDKDTSGAMVAAKSDTAHLKLAEMFAIHKVKREYLALVSGIISPSSGTISKPIAKSRTNREKMCVAAGGKPAITHYSTEKVFTDGKSKPVSLLRLTLETGRTHQIRVHLADAGHPILGDKVYAPAAVAAMAPRQMLHSANIAFSHPTTKKALKFSAPMPEDFKR